jgi:hypothetical protein
MGKSETLTITLTILYMVAVWVITLIYIKPLMQ